MTPEAIIALVQFAIKFGIDAAIALGPLFKTGATVDEAIAALQVAKTKTAQDYLAEAKASVPPPV